MQPHIMQSGSMKRMTKTNSTMQSHITNVNLEQCTYQCNLWGVQSPRAAIKSWGADSQRVSDPVWTISRMQLLHMFYCRDNSAQLFTNSSKRLGLKKQPLCVLYSPRLTIFSVHWTPQLQTPKKRIIFERNKIWSEHWIFERDSTEGGGGGL